MVPHPLPELLPISWVAKVVPIAPAILFLHLKVEFLGGEMEEHGGTVWMERYPLAVPPQRRCLWHLKGKLSYLEIFSTPAWLFG